MSEKIKITFLGTSGAFPTAKRNHPSFLLSYKGENILVDCGEGTQRQFRKARLNPCKLTRVLITHWHGDHVLGIPGLFQTLSLNEYNKTLLIYGPKGIKEHIKNVLRAFPSVNTIKLEVEEVSGKFFETEDFFIEAEKMSHGTPCNAYSFVEKGKMRIDKSKLKKSGIGEGPHLKELKNGKDIIHNGKKYKFKDLTFEEGGRKISFVLDTLSNNKIKEFSKDSDVLVIESTFDSSMKDYAEERKHLTFDQSAKVAKDSKSKALYLVHISDRYEQDFDSILKEVRKIFKNSFIPKDLDSVEI